MTFQAGPMYLVWKDYWGGRIHEVANRAGNRPVVAISLDVDWASEAEISSVAELLRGAGVPATFFATHDSATLHDLEAEGFEIGLHPNYDGCADLPEGPLETLGALYPNAIGARSHRLHVSSRILDAYVAKGMAYESNIFLDGLGNLWPVSRSPNLLSIPFTWSDDKHIELRRPMNKPSFDLSSDGLHVFNFHPVHVFMNTHSEAHYASFKELSEEDRLRAREQTDTAGIRDVFVKLLTTIGAAGVRPWTLREIWQTWR